LPEICSVPLFELGIALLFRVHLAGFVRGCWWGRHQGVASYDSRCKDLYFVLGYCMSSCQGHDSWQDLSVPGRSDCRTPRSSIVISKRPCWIPDPTGFHGLRRKSSVTVWPFQLKFSRDRRRFPGVRVKQCQWHRPCSSDHFQSYLRRRLHPHNVVSAIAICKLTASALGTKNPKDSTIHYDSESRSEPDSKQKTETELTF